MRPYMIGSYEPDRLAVNRLRPGSLDPAGTVDADARGIPMIDERDPHGGLARAALALATAIIAEVRHSRRCGVTVTMNQANPA